jgi:hypothetical protein
VHDLAEAKRREKDLQGIVKQLLRAIHARRSERV